MKVQRLDKIIDLVNKNGYCSNEMISDELDIPLTTLRRYLDYLDDEKLIVRVYGGAKSIKKVSNIEEKIKDKISNNVEEKKVIAKKAFACIKKGETIYIDAGSTTYQVIEFITKDLNLKIYTNSIEHALALSTNGIENINLLPGKLKNSTGALVGVETIEAINNYYFDVALIGINAVDSEFNYYTTDTEEAAVKKTVINRSKLSFGLADSTKFNSVSFVKFSSKIEMPVISEEI